MSTNHDTPVITAHQDPPGQPVWAMQLVALVPKADPPTRTDVCTAAALATVRLLSADLTPEQGAAVEQWLAGRIRKHVRRARGAAWEKVAAVAGVTASSGTATVRAFYPCPVDQIPDPIGRLQLTGPDLPDPAPARHLDPVPGGPVVVHVRDDLPWGKAAAAAAHAAQLAAAHRPVDQVQVAFADPDTFALAQASAQVTIADAGFTVVAPGTVTACAHWA